MTQIQPNSNLYTNQTATPLYNYANNTTMTQPQQQSVYVQSSDVNPIYQYPQTSLYNSNSKQTTTGTTASGVNIYIYNPSAIGAPTAQNSYTLPNSTQQAPVQNVVAQQPIQTQETTPVASTPINSDTKETTSSESKKTKNIVKLTDDYIKTLESYLRSPDKTVRRSGIKELLNRFEEDDSRYDNPSLTALLNIALQDTDVSNRMLAMSTIAGGSAHGDENTIEFLKNATKSEEMYGQEAVMANNALLKAAQTRIEVPDNSPDVQQDNEINKMYGNV